MLDGIMSLASVPERLQQFISLVMEAASLVMEAADKYQDAEKAAALEAIDVTGREQAGEAIDDAATVERLAYEMARFAYAVKPDGDIFPDAYRRAFTEEFLRRNPAALPYKSDVEESVRRWFRELEGVLHDNYSKEGRVILRYEILNRTDLDAIKRDLAEILARLRSEQDPGAPSTSNQDYKEIFEAPLFLHRGNYEISLQNLFVPHRFTVKNGFDSAESMDEYLAQFVRDTKTRFLFIEGDAGCGKSSLTAYLSWHYEQRDTTARDIFGDAQLMTVRLRDIDIPTGGKREERLKLGVLRSLYRKGEPDSELKKRFRESGPRVLLLDGYDELCTIEGIENSDAALKRLNELDCKIIVTARPAYIDCKRFEKPYWHIALEHFDAAQRREWLERYERCGQTLGEVNRQYLERIGGDETAGICDTPMGLYMVAAGHFKPHMLENEWAIYHQIFYSELGETKYNDSSEAHSILDYQKPLYRVSEEIAWYLYQRNNENLLVPGSEIKRIIGELKRDRELAEELEEDEWKIVERCFALCGYWKANTGRGCVEFYHNNIRDFFLCEKLMRELNNAYREYGDALRDERGDITPFLRRLCELFQYGKLNKTVLFFIKQRAAYADKEPDLCVDTEREERHTARIFETMLFRGDFYSVCAERWKTENPVKTIGRILGNTVAVYRFLYESFLEPGEHILWWIEENAVNKDKTLWRLADEILQYAGPSDLRGAYLRGADLQDAVLRGADLRGADLYGAYLQGAVLRGADLYGAYLQGAVLRFADLQGAVLRGANLHNANLRNADLRGENLHNANLHNADLQGADLQDADLRGAVLSGAVLHNANLRNANLRGADLQGAYLRGAVLSGADLQGADLQGAYLQGADLRGAEGYNLKDTIGTPITD